MWPGPTWPGSSNTSSTAGPARLALHTRCGQVRAGPRRPLGSVTAWRGGLVTGWRYPIVSVSPLRVTALGERGAVAGPRATEPSLMLNSAPWQGQMIVPPLTPDT